MLEETKLRAIEERLAALPAVQKMTLATTLERLTPVINSLRGKGYSQEQVTAALTRELSGLGLTVSTRALARHVPAKPRAKRRASRT